MKAKIISLILARKFKSFVRSLPEELQKEVSENCVITGGCIVSLLQNEPVNDYDLYFTNPNTAKKVADHLVAKFMEKPPKAFTDSGGKMGKTISVQLEECTTGIHPKIYIKSAGVVGEKSDEYKYYENRPDSEADDYVDALDKTEQASVETDPENKEYRPVFLSENAISLTGKIQVVLRFCGSPEEIHKNYDFVHCTNYWESSTGILTLKKEALECIHG